MEVELLGIVEYLPWVRERDRRVDSRALHGTTKGVSWVKTWVEAWNEHGTIAVGKSMGRLPLT